MNITNKNNLKKSEPIIKQKKTKIIVEMNRVMPNFELIII